MITFLTARLPFNLVVGLYICFFYSLPLASAQDLDCSSLPSGSYALCDNFNDGNFTDSPTWTGNTADWLVDNGLLRANGPTVTGTMLELVTPISLNNGQNLQWEFFANPALATSSGNYADVFLMSTTADLLNDTESGYFVRLGGTPDEISLYRASAGSNTLIIDGTDGSLSSSSQNPVSVKVVRASDGTFSLFIDVGALGSYQSDGSTTDNTYLPADATHAGVRIRYSQANATDFYFDNFYIGNEIIDTTPPSITALNVLNANQVQLTLSEGVTNATAEDLSNYTLNGSTNPVEVQHTPQSITLSFANNFASGQTNTLTVSNLQDAAGNTLTTQNFTFTHISISPNDVLINELLPDPSPVVGLPDAEFIELRNNTATDLNLAGFSITDNYPSLNNSFPPVTIQANGYLLIVAQADVPLFSEAYPTANILGITNFPSLNNSADVLSLVSNNNVIIDEVAYTNSWYKDADKDDGGYSLERILADSPCASSTAELWMASTDASGGTPGAVNSVDGQLNDTEAPQITALSLPNNQTIVLTLSETPVAATAQAISNYTLQPAIAINSILQDENEITIFLDGSLTEGQIYTLSLNGISDCFGNATDGTSATLALPEPAQAYDVLINEIFADYSVPEGLENPALGLPQTEYVELYNRSNKVINLAGYQFRDSGDTTYLASYLLLPKAYVVLCGSNDSEWFTNEGLPVMEVSGFPSLNDSGDNLVLANAQGEVLHTAFYKRSWYKSEIKEQGGYSLELIDPSNPCQQGDNWLGSKAAIGGTPGSVNSVDGDNPDTTAPNLLRAEYVSDLLVQVFFDETIERYPDASQFLVDDAIMPLTAAAVAPDFTSIILSFAQPLSSTIIHSLSVQQVADCSGNVQATTQMASFGKPEPAEPGDLIINEVLTNPLSGGSDYVELYNNSNKVLSLGSWFTATADVEANTDSLFSISPIVNSGYSIYPGQYIVLTENAEQLMAQYGGACGPVVAARIIETNLPTLADDEGIIAITDLFGSTILDKLHYNADWHNPLIDDENGVALERISPNAPTNEANNWLSAAASHCYGTPTYANSQLFESESTATTELLIEPATISPNSDGYQDFASIIFTLGQSGYTANISIFDERGREIRQLTQNQLLGATQSIIWDGTITDGTRAPVGIYIVFVELVNTDGSVEQFKETITLVGSY